MIPEQGAPRGLCDPRRDLSSDQVADGDPFEPITKREDRGRIVRSGLARRRLLVRVALWFSVPGGVWTTPTRFEGTLYAVRGQPTFGLSMTAAGRLTLDFLPGGDAAMTYVIYELVFIPELSANGTQRRTITKRLTRLEY